MTLYMVEQERDEESSRAKEKFCHIEMEAITGFLKTKELNHEYI